MIQYIFEAAKKSQVKKKKRLSGASSRMLHVVTAIRVAYGKFRVYRVNTVWSSRVHSRDASVAARAMSVIHTIKLAAPVPYSRKSHSEQRP